MGRTARVISSKGKGKTVSQIRNLAVSGPSIAQFSSFLKSPGIK